MDVQELKEKKVSQLLSIANSLEIEGASSMRKQELIFAILQAHQQQEKEQPIPRRRCAGNVARRIWVPQSA